MPVNKNENMRAYYQNTVHTHTGTSLDICKKYYS